MYCNNCGYKLENEMVNFCPSCGKSHLPFNQMPQKKGKSNYAIEITIAISIVFMITTIFVVSNYEKIFGFHIKPDGGDPQSSESPIVKSPKGKTIIKYDNYYDGVRITTQDEAFALIVKDSVDQKKNCPPKIKEIEDRMIKNIKVNAVNLCEISYELAEEMESVFDFIYKEVPSIRHILTNISIYNDDNLTGGAIAVFIPVKYFASEKDYSFPVVSKTLMMFNSEYYLNEAKLENTVRGGANAGHFPKNASKTSPIAHEFAHFLSYLTLLKKYSINDFLLINENNVSALNKLIKDFNEGNNSLEMVNIAYENYKRKYNDVNDLNSFKLLISGYAAAKDNNGNYIHDETIAESFHDFYINKNNASKASIEVVNVLIDRLKG